MLAPLLLQVPYEVFCLASNDFYQDHRYYHLSFFFIKRRNTKQELSPFYSRRSVQKVGTTIL